MAQYAKLNKPYDQIIAQSYALPANATPVDLTNVCKIDAGRSGTIWARFYASDTTVEITNPATITFIPCVGKTAATATFAAGVVLPGVMVSSITASANTTISWAPGVMICEMAIPMETLKALAASNTAGTAPAPYLYLGFAAVAVSNEAGDNIEAYLFVE